jgi:O-antigen ligase
MSFEPGRIRLQRKLTVVGVPKPVLISLLFYIATLMATQTVYGVSFLPVRWIALGILTLISFVYWLLGRIPRKGGGEVRHDPVMVFVYLGATLLSVAFAENHEFSGLRWMTQGMLILSCMVFLRGTFNPEKMEGLLLPLKVVSLSLLLISLIFPAPLNVYDNPYFRGAMGDSNSFGHASAICALVYLQGAVTGKRRGWRIIQSMVAGIAMVMLVQSAARSSMAAFLAGFILISYYFGLTRSLLSKGVILLVVAFLVASPGMHEKIGSFIAKEDRDMERQAKATPMEMYFKSGFLPGHLFATRERLWSEAWKGFLERPVLGWGFGANANIPKEWSIGPTGFGLTRDLTNDLLFTLEGSGCVGFLGYLALMFSILRRSPTRPEILLIRKGVKKQTYSSPIKLANNSFHPKASTSMPQKYDVPGRDEDGKIMEDLTWSRACVHSQMYILAVSLFVLFFFDGSAFSAGSLISAIFWISAGAASLTRTEFAADERMNRKIRKELEDSRGQGFRGSNIPGRRNEGWP